MSLPSIQQGAPASSGALEWVVSGYALTFGLALVPAGRLGDRYGYKRLFLAGLSLFTLASAACGVSQNSGELIIARLIQGLGAGIYYPAISAIIQRLFTGRDRSCAFGYLGGIVGVSTAAGPLPGGLLVQLAGVTDGWRWVFLVNLFIGIAALPVAFRLLPSRHDPEEHQLDFAGNLLLAAVLLLILVPLVEGRVSGWPAWSWLLLGLAVPATAALVAWELRLEHRGGELVIAPNQDFVLASVPREQAGTAGGALITAQRLGAAIGIAVIGTDLFGSGSGAEAAPGTRPGRRCQRWCTRRRPQRWSTCASSPWPSRAPSACRPGSPARTRNRKQTPHRPRASGRNRAPRSQTQTRRPDGGQPAHDPARAGALALDGIAERRRSTCCPAQAEFPSPESAAGPAGLGDPAGLALHRDPARPGRCLGR